MVIDNGGRTYFTVWGDILTNVAKQRGVAGTVIDGVCRDIDGIAEQQYPIYARGTFMVTGKDRVQLVAVGELVSVANVRIDYGDIILADRGGVLAIAASRAEEVLEKAFKLEAVEEAIVKAVTEGLPCEKHGKPSNTMSFSARKNDKLRMNVLSGTVFTTASFLNVFTVVGSVVGLG